MMQEARKPEKSFFIGSAQNLRGAIITVMQICLPHLCHLPPEKLKDHGVHVMYQTCTKPATWTSPKININSKDLKEKRDAQGNKARPWRVIKKPTLSELLHLKKEYDQTQEAKMRRHIKSNTHKLMFLIGFLRHHSYMNSEMVFLSPPYRVESGVGGDYNWHIRVFFHKKMKCSGGGRF